MDHQYADCRQTARTAASLTGTCHVMYELTD